MFNKIIVTKWNNIEKTLIAVKAEMADGNIQQMQIAKYDEAGNVTNDYQELMKVYSEENIERDHENILKEREQQQQDSRQKEIAEKEERIKQAQIQKIFEAKLEVFEIEEVKQSKNRELRSRIRRAKSLAEIYALAGIMIMSETPALLTNILNNETQTENDETPAAPAE